MTSSCFSIRPVKTEELKPWLDLANQFRHWQEDVPGFLFEETLRRVDEPTLRLGAWTTDGLLAGTAEAAVGEDGERGIDRARGFVVVAPAYRRQGVGARLGDAGERFPGRVRGTSLQAQTRATGIARGLPLL